MLVEKYEPPKKKKSDQAAQLHDLALELTKRGVYCGLDANVRSVVW
jgi:hypothetical protein